MRILAIAGLSIALSLSLGCRHEPTAAQTKEYYAEQNDRADLEIARLEVQAAEQDQQIARAQGKRPDPQPLVKAQAHLLSATNIVALWDDRAQLKRTSR